MKVKKGQVYKFHGGIIIIKNYNTYSYTTEQNEDTVIMWNCTRILDGKLMKENHTEFWFEAQKLELLTTNDKLVEILYGDENEL